MKQQNQRVYGIYLGVNYLSSEELEENLSRWRAFKEIDAIFIVDNYSTIQERDLVRCICEKYEACLIEKLNIGYGAALNCGLDVVAELHKDKSYVVFFGNVDIFPTRLDLACIEDAYVPMLNINELNVNKNPFLKKIHRYFIFIPCMAAKFESKFLLLIWLVVQKIIHLIPGKPIAVHGSLFCLTSMQLLSLMPIFNADVFLYCEEMFFMRKISRLGLEFKQSENYFMHSGSISTSKTIKLDKKSFFLNWAKSMRAYCNE
jgi:GT2 family glycosyltransferase